MSDYFCPYHTSIGLHLKLRVMQKEISAKLTIGSLGFLCYLAAGSVLPYWLCWLHFCGNVSLLILKEFSVDSAKSPSQSSDSMFSSR